MSDIDYSWLGSQYKSFADDFINKINNTTMTLFFTNTIIQNSNIPKPNEFGVDALGGRSLTSDLDGRRNEQNLNQGHLSPTGVDIKVRAYWKEKDDEKIAKEIGIRDVQSLCKVISFTEHNQTIRNAQYAEIDGYKLKMVRIPLPHGLFGDKRYSTSYWEIID